MDASVFATTFNGREIGNEVSRDEGRALAVAGLVAVFGASDDLMEFRGAIYDEVECYGGGTAYLDESGPLENLCSDDACPYFADMRSLAATINAVWNDGDGPSWSYTTKIPHETFEIVEDGEPYCVGIVFSSGPPAVPTLHRDRAVCERQRECCCRAYRDRREGAEVPGLLGIAVVALGSPGMPPEGRDFDPPQVVA